MLNKFKIVGCIIGFFFFLAYCTGSMMFATFDITQWEETMRIILGGLSGVLSLIIIAGLASAWD